MTYNEVISRVQNTLNAINKDMYIPKRYVLAVLKSKAEFLVSQKFNDKSLFREMNIFSWVNCVEMKEMDTYMCGLVELEDCGTVMVTKVKLPELIWSRYGSSILMVTNITNSKKYQLISPLEFMNIKNRSNFEKFKGKYAIIYPDNRIIIPDSTVKRINVLLYTLDESIINMGYCEECDNCNNYYDAEFNLPNKIGEAVIQEAIKEISLRMQIPKDELPSGNSNEKNPNPN
jgi:hypothetical protein